MKTPSVLLALFLFAPVLPAAGQNSAVECRWTDNPIIAGETPIRAVHLQEIRDCLDRILAALPGQPPVEPGNRAPQAVGVLPPLRIEAGAAPEVVDVGQSFRDPNGDVLTYSAASSDWRVAGVSVSGRRLTIRPVTEGSAVMTVTAADPGGLTAVQTFTVMVDTPAVTAFTVSNIRRFQRQGRPDWAHHRRPLESADRLLGDRTSDFEHPDGFTRCFKRARNVLPGEFEEFDTTPTSCGFSQQWHRVHITPAVDYSCEGCGTFERLFLPVR